MEMSIYHLASHLSQSSPQTYPVFFSFLLLFDVYIYFFPLLLTDYLVSCFWKKGQWPEIGFLTIPCSLGSRFSILIFGFGLKFFFLHVLHLEWFVGMHFVCNSLKVRNSLFGFAILHLSAFALSKCSVCNALYVYMFFVCISCSVCQILILSAFLCLSAFACLQHSYVCMACLQCYVCLHMLFLQFSDCLHFLYMHQLLYLPVQQCPVCNSLPVLDVLVLLFSACLHVFYRHYLSVFVCFICSSWSVCICFICTSLSVCLFLSEILCQHASAPSAVLFHSEYVLSVCMCSVCNFLSVCS